MLCKYGCGKEAVYEDCCSEFATQCQVNRDKNSSGMVTAHKTSNNYKGNNKFSWATGLTKDTDKRIKNNADSRTFPLDKVMVENSTYTRGNLKARLLKEGILENKCNICGLDPVWQDKKLTLILDHKNGVNNDHRIENLQLVCPNCNSQLPTFAGRNTKRIRKSRKTKCKQCDNLCCIGTQSGLCNQCYGKLKVGVKNSFYGKHQTEAVKDIISKAQTGKGNSQYGSRWMNYSGAVKKVRGVDIPGYLKNNWKFGKKI